ncbi:hypothetical protein EV360DRAFT_81777 [Lentinula raphanica]|nr:hypothetical protein EV360DRAFT_81777 [Lentinula raphanica]
MSQIEDFESTLKEVVQAKRLSASKMTKVTDLAMKLMKDDTQLVSILYRTHKSLSPSAKVSSLYVFDALARAAKHQANKQNLVGDINASEGNCATFLLKLQGILDGLFKDMVLSGTPESKEKSKKILDIWVKGNTFPSTMLSQLADVLKVTVKENAAKAAVPSDPRIAAAAQNAASKNTPTPPISNTPPFPPSAQSTNPAHAPTPSLDPQSKILALLSQAIHAGAASTPTQASTANGLTPTVPMVGAPVDVAQAQLALLQQLTQTAHIGPNMSYPTNTPVPTNVNATHPPSDSSDYGPLAGDTHHQGYDYSDDDYRRDGRGGTSRVYRGGRGRWNEGRGKRDGRDHFRDRDRGAKRSRSRSPPSRYGARREIKPYSPSRRPLPAVRESNDTGASEPGGGSFEKDEFGRDVRTQAPESPKDAVDPPTGIHDETSASASVVPPPMQSSADISPIVPSSSIPSTSNAGSHNNLSQSPGIDQFNVATFDFTNPGSWEALGNMWFISYGTMPTTEQLMQFVMLAGTTAGSSQMMSQDSWDQSGWENTGLSYTNAQGMSTMGPEGMNGGMGYGGSQLQGLSTGNGNGSTTAGDPRMQQGMVRSKANEPPPEKRGAGGGGGGMRKVGDKWIFVRDTDAAAS